MSIQGHSFEFKVIAVTNAWWEIYVFPHSFRILQILLVLTPEILATKMNGNVINIIIIIKPKDSNHIKEEKKTYKFHLRSHF